MGLGLSYLILSNIDWGGGGVISTPTPMILPLELSQGVWYMSLVQRSKACSSKNYTSKKLKAYVEKIFKNKYFLLLTNINVWNMLFKAFLNI